MKEHPDPVPPPSLTGVRLAALFGVVVAVVVAVVAFGIAWPLGVLVVFLSPGFPLVAAVGFEAVRGGSG